MSNAWLSSEENKIQCTLKLRLVTVWGHLESEVGPHYALTCSNFLSISGCPESLAPAQVLVVLPSHCGNEEAPQTSTVSF